MAEKVRGGCPEFGTIAFRVNGPIPRKAPYAKFRGRLYVPSDLRGWRGHIAKNFLLAGGRKPYGTEQPDVVYQYTFKRSHADLDSITHSAQDALTKDALSCADKEWWGRYYRLGGAARGSKESLQVTVRYLSRARIEELLRLGKTLKDYDG